MWSDLRAAVPQGSSALQSLGSSLPDVALTSRACTQYLVQVFFFPQQTEVLGTRTWLDSFSRFSVSLRYLSASFKRDFKIRDYRRLDARSPMSGGLDRVRSVVACCGAET